MYTSFCFGWFNCWIVVPQSLRSMSVPRSFVWKHCKGVVLFDDAMLIANFKNNVLYIHYQVDTSNNWMMIKDKMVRFTLGHT